jgi:SagB-type dehydrogenase family enzyme
MSVKNKLKEILNQPITLSERFHEKTKYKKLIKELSVDFWPESWKKVYFKAYSRFKEIRLPKPSTLRSVSFNKVLYGRRSYRSFSKMKPSVTDLSTMLFYAAGIRKKSSLWQGNRFYPSAGSRYPLEIYLISLNTELDRGIYHYYVKTHSLEKLDRVDDFNVEEYFNQEWIKNAACLVVISGFFKRSTMKYGERGYRHALIESGHMAQNIYLTCAAINLGCCSIGGWIDRKFEQMLNIDGVEESVIQVLAAGKKA